MSGKPAAVPAKPAAAKEPASKPKATVPAKAEAPKRQAPARKVGETVADDDDPFGVDTSSVAQVPKAAPRPAKGRMIRIVCPMCETPGFISSKMQGRDVKCCNADCMVPVFKAPAPEKKVTEDDSKRGGLSMQKIGIAAAVIVPLAVLILWGFVFSRQGGGGGGLDGGVTTVDPIRIDIGGSEVPENGGDELPKPTGPTAIPLEQIKQAALEQIVKAAQLREDNRKPFGRRLAAESYALVGNLTAAGEQLKQLKSVRAPSYFATEPLLLIAREQLRAGDTAGATGSIQQAGEAFRRLPGQGRAELTAAISLAAAQAAFDRIDDALATLGAVEPEPERARLAALMQIVCAFETFDLDEILAYSSLDMAADPLAVATAIEIAAQGFWDKAIAWAQSQEGSASREDGLTALAAFAALLQARSGDAGPLTQLTGLAGELSATGQARLHAGIATGYLMQQKRTEAEAALAKAVEVFATIERPTPLATPSVKAIHNSKKFRGAGLPDASPLRSAAVAAAQLARLQLLSDQREAAWTTLLEAWDFTAGIGPNYGDISALRRELNNKARTQQRLNQALRLRDRDERFRALNQYRSQLGVFDAAARKRFEIETALLDKAAGWGFVNEVARFRKEPGGSFPAAAGQPYPAALKEDPLTKLFAETEGLFKQAKFREAAELLASIDGRRPRPPIGQRQRRDQRAMQLACRLLKQKQVDQLFGYLDALKDPWLTEDCLEMTAALGVLDGQASAIWRLFPEHDLQATERVALYRGLISGIVLTEQQGSQSQETASVGSASAK